MQSWITPYDTNLFIRCVLLSIHDEYVWGLVLWTRPPSMGGHTILNVRSYLDRIDVHDVGVDDLVANIEMCAPQRHLEQSHSFDALLKGSQEGKCDELLSVHEYPIIPHQNYFFHVSAESLPFWRFHGGIGRQYIEGHEKEILDTIREAVEPSVERDPFRNFTHR